MAIGKSVNGKGFKGAASYILNKKDAEFLFGNNVYTTDPEIIAKQMRIAADSKNIKSPVMHFSISLNHGEKGTNDQWKKAADAFLVEMGFDLKNTQYIVARHSDTKHDHIHILANRVMLNNQVVNNFQHKVKAHHATRAAELAAGFKQFESKRERETRKFDVKQKIDIAIINSSKNGRSDYAQFKNELKNMGIEVKENRSQTTDRLNGISYAEADNTYKGSSLGKAYSLGGLEARGLDAGRQQLKQAQHSPINRPTGARPIYSSDQATAARVAAERHKKDAQNNKAAQNNEEVERERLKFVREKEMQDEEEL